MSGELEIREIHSHDDPRVTRLIAESDAYLESLYPPESNHAEPIESLIGGAGAFFVALIDARMVACGAVKLVNGRSGYGELKRLFVREDCRPLSVFMEKRL